MNYAEAKELLDQGKRVRLPEWTGYWMKETLPNGLGDIWAFTRTGDVVPAWKEEDPQTTGTRTDWEEVTTEGLGFDWAILALKAGKQVCRSGWNGKGMWLVLIHPGNAMFSKHSGAWPMQVCIGMKTADHKMQPGWLASQTDMLATDWVLADTLRAS